MTLILGLCVIAATAVAILRGIDVRPALLISSIALALIAGLSNCIESLAAVNSTVPESLNIFAKPLLRVLRAFLSTFSDERYVVPICLSMAFARVLAKTNCDEHLVHLLIRPFSRVPRLFLPGVILTGFLVNIPLISQGATAAVVGTVLVPLGRSLGFAPTVIGAALLLGCSIGGELLNPGAPELRTIVEYAHGSATTVDSLEAVKRIIGFLPWHLLTASLLFLLLNRATAIDAERRDSVGFLVNFLKAGMPFVPLLLIVLIAPPIQLFHIPQEWLLFDPSSKAETRAFEGRFIGAAMLIGTMLVIVATPGSASAAVKAFFDGAGFAFTFIIGMIVSATCFAEGVRSLGTAEFLGKLISYRPGLLFPLAALLPMAFGALAGSGVAATQALYQLFVAPSIAAAIDPVRTGAVVSIGAAAGRTMSPVSPVALMSSQLAEVNPIVLSGKVAVPLIGGLIVVVLIALLS
jgi:DcuC family C4-dicarboxylate transporter